MKLSGFFIAFFLISGTMVPFHTQAATINYWTLGSDGDWDTAANWSTGQVPNGARDQVWIDNDSGTNVSVSLNSSKSVSGLSVDSGDALSVNDGNTLSLRKDDGGNNPTITNNGTITLNSTGTATRLRAQGAEVTLTGSGRLLLGGSGLKSLDANKGGSFINDINHTIEGGGTLSAPLRNEGTIIANDGTLRLSGEVTGSGNISVSDNATLDINANLETGNLSMSQLAMLDVAPNKIVEIHGDMTFSQTDPSLMKWGKNSALKLSGTSPQSIEMGGYDYGADASGFSNNFSLEKLIIEGEIYLTDLIDNGNGGGGLEALYVDELEILTGAILNLNGLNMYTYVGGTIQLVNAGSGYLFGGGTVVDAAVPIPTSILLLGSGLFALVALRRRGQTQVWA